MIRERYVSVGVARFSVALVLASIPGAMIACGGSSKPAASPTTSASSAAPHATTAAAPRSTATATPTTAPSPTVAAAPPSPPSATPTTTPSITGSARDAYDRGVAAYRAGNLTGAVQGFQQAISAEPTAYEAQYALGMAFERLGRTSDALGAYRESSKLKPDFTKATAAYCFLLYKSGSHTEAETTLTDAQAKSPNDVLLMTALAELRSLLGDSATAQQLASNALTLDAKYEPAMVLIARDYFRSGRIDLATYVLSAILDGQKTEEERTKGEPAKKNPPRAPTNAEAHFLRALIFQRQGDRLRAAQWFESAVKSRPDLVDAQLALGMIRLEANDADGALDPLRAAVGFDPARVEAHLALGEAYRLTARAADAKNEYQWVISSGASTAQQKALAQYDLGLLYFLTPGLEGLSDSVRFDRAVDLWNLFKAAKGSASGPSWPADADDLIDQSRRAKATAAAAAGAAGGTKPKPAVSVVPDAVKIAPSAVPAPSPATSAKPVTTTAGAASSASPTPTTSTSAKSMTSGSTAPSSSAKPAAAPSGAPR